MFNQREVNQIFSHIPSRTLRQWALAGLYQWEEETEDARGTKRHYTVLNLYQIGLTEVLAKINFPIHRIKNIMEHFFVGNKFQEEKIALMKFDGYLVHGESLFLTNSREYFSLTYNKESMPISLKDNPILAKCMVITIIDLEEIKKRVKYLISQAM
jgi:DNA-binding transcriptional MerR regulator